MKEINLMEGFQYNLESYQQSGIYHNKLDGCVYAVSLKNSYISFIGQYEQVKDCFSNNQQQPIQSTGISEDYSLRLVQTIISELKK